MLCAAFLEEYELEVGRANSLVPHCIGSGASEVSVLLQGPQDEHSGGVCDFSRGIFVRLRAGGGGWTGNAVEADQGWA